MLPRKHGMATGSGGKSVSMSTEGVQGMDLDLGQLRAASFSAEDCKAANLQVAWGLIRQVREHLVPSRWTEKLNQIELKLASGLYSDFGAMCKEMEQAGAECSLDKFFEDHVRRCIPLLERSDIEPQSPEEPAPATTREQGAVTCERQWARWAAICDSAWSASLEMIAARAEHRIELLESQRAKDHLWVSALLGAKEISKRAHESIHAKMNRRLPRATGHTRSVVPRLAGRWRYVHGSELARYPRHVRWFFTFIQYTEILASDEEKEELGLQAFPELEHFLDECRSEVETMVSLPPSRVRMCDSKRAIAVFLRACSCLLAHTDPVLANVNSKLNAKFQSTTRALRQSGREPPTPERQEQFSALRNSVRILLLTLFVDNRHLRQLHESQVEKMLDEANGALMAKHCLPPTRRPQESVQDGGEDGESSTSLLALQPLFLDRDSCFTLTIHPDSEELEEGGAVVIAAGPFQAIQSSEAKSLAEDQPECAGVSNKRKRLEQEPEGERSREAEEPQRKLK